ncbi:uncharacterized protein LOC113316119 [Papaver somniferum]|uniref:uncharacterized protein LOC113316119 n=1 Tax=Papaver somniferum TaxID=3469 RepID=UPI000E701795|nr:uncharacterized protein LOC113316119 [Papaver somniferum]
MKPILEKIISPFQAAYVSGSLISDNTVIAQEIIHSMKKKRGETGWMVSKLDMYKAFDRLEWSFLIKCVSTTSLSVMLNGSPCEEFSPTRDDCLIFTQANLNSVNNLLELLHNSSQTGQVINFEKSAVHFSKKTKPEVAETLTQTLGVKIMNSKEKYLGSPLILSHSKQESFKSTKEKFEHRFSSWSSTSLSQAGRGTMINRVLDSVHVYQMGTFKLPNNLIQQLSTIEREFFWGYNNNRGSNPTTWINVCIPKDLGGLDFKDLEKINLALLKKRAWRICNDSS